MISASWQDATERIAQFTRGSMAPATPSEIACAALGRGSGHWLDLQLDRMTPRRWTRLSFATLRAASEPSNDSLPPPDMLVPALRCIGLSALDIDMQRIVVEAAMRGRPDAAVSKAVQALANAAPDPTGSRRLGLVVAADQSLTELWSGAAMDAFVLVATPSEWDGFLKTGGGKLLEAVASVAGDVQVTLAWEALAASETQAADLLKRLNAIIRVSREVWLYPSLSAGQRTPSVIRPAKASALWSTNL